MIFSAVRMVFHDKNYLFWLLLLSAAFSWLLIYIPVKNIPGNDFAFQLSIMTRQDKLLLGLVSVLTALSLTMNFYLFKSRSSTTLGTGGLIAGMVGSVFGTASCAACALSLFGFLGFGGVLFLFKYRIWIAMGSVAVLIGSLYFTSQKILGVCKLCKN